MGLDFIRAKDKNFTQQRDKSKIQEFEVGDLLTKTKPDAFVPLFRCQLTVADTILVPGLNLIGRATSETQVVVS